jgi:hypothetical protein
MQAGNTDKRKGFADNRHPKAGTLIKLCKPPYISISYQKDSLSKDTRFFTASLP